MKMAKNNTKMIMNYLLRNFDLKNINQISKELKISLGSVFKILKNLEANKIVSFSKLGNAIYYTLNLENKETFKILELMILEERRTLNGYAELYAREIESFKEAELIIIFGSVLKNNSFNDIDVLFMTSEVKKVSKFCLEISKIKSKPVVPLILNKKDLIEEIKNKKSSILEIIKTGVVLKGEDSFLEVIKNAKK
jgi:DNA-binding Lrp family transcriptional regulator